MSIIDSLRAWSKAKKVTVSVIAAVAAAAVGTTIYLINRNLINGYASSKYKGWYNGQWVDLEEINNSSNATNYYTIKSNGEVYYNPL